MTEDVIKKYMSKIGTKGGKASGAVKRRGDAEYYREISRKGVATRAARRAAKKAKKTKKD